MKALQMEMSSQAKAATQNRVWDMRTLKGGVGSKTLDTVQIAKLVAQKKKEKELRAWEKFGKTSQQLGSDIKAFKNKRKPLPTSPTKVLPIK